jgi:hypothetical protein
MLAFAQPVPQAVWMDGLGRRHTRRRGVGQHPPGTGRAAVTVDEAQEHAGADDGGERFRRFAAERGDPYGADRASQSAALAS